MSINAVVKTMHNRRVAHLFLLASVMTLSACGTFYQPTSPDVLYSDASTEARQLQVPPDLTDVSDGEQFVLPGNGGGTVTRNTLLPEFESVRFRREREISWLAFKQSPEDIWPRLLAFLRSQKYRVEQTEPTAGTIVSQWRSAAEVESGGILKGLIGGDEDYSRVAFRLERGGDGSVGARLFARQQTGSEALVKSDTAVLWPARSSDPEVTSELLNRLLVFLGVDEQKSQGLLDEEQARAVLDDAAVQTTAAGRQLLVNRGFVPTFRAVTSALQQMDHAISSSDDGVGRIEFIDESESLVVSLVPVHVSAVRLSLSDEDGRRLDAERERKLLTALRDAIA